MKKESSLSEPLTHDPVQRKDSSRPSDAKMGKNMVRKGKNYQGGTRF